jgi:hypothetical protein
MIESQSDEVDDQRAIIEHQGATGFGIWLSHTNVATGVPSLRPLGKRRPWQS